MSKDFIFIWIIFSGVLLGLTSLLVIYILLSKFFGWLKFTKNLKFVKNNLLNKVVEERSMSVSDVIYQEDTKEVTDEFSEEIRQFKQEITSGNGQMNNLGNRYFFHSDDIHLYTSLQNMLKEQQYLQQKDIVPLQEKLDTSLSAVSSDIHSLRTDIISHTQQLEQISTTLQEFTKEGTVDKRIHDSIYHELKTFSVQLKNTVDSYIDKKVQQAIPEKKASYVKDATPFSAGLIQEQKLYTDLLRQKMNYMFVITFLSFIIVLLVGYFLLAFL